MMVMRALSIYSAVIARLDRATQYATAYPLNHGRFGVLDPRFRGDDDHF